MFIFKNWVVKKDPPSLLATDLEGLGLKFVV